MVCGGAAILLGDMLLAIVGVALGAVALIVTIVLGWGSWRDRRFRRRHTEAGRAERRLEAAVRAFKKRGGPFMNRKTVVVDRRGVISAGFKPRPRWQVRLISCRNRLTRFGTLMYNKIVRG